MLKTTTISFQMTEELGVHLTMFLIQSSIVWGKIYFPCIADLQQQLTSSYILLIVIWKRMRYISVPSHHKLLAVLFSDATQGRVFSSLLPAHRNIPHILLIVRRIPFGAHVIVVQYTEIASKADFIIIKRPALDNHLGLQ